MPDWPQLKVSGSFEITRPSVIPLSTWTSTFNGTVLRDDLNSGNWVSITPYFSIYHPDDTGSAMYPSQSFVNQWATEISESGYNMSQSLHYKDVSGSLDTHYAEEN